MLAAGQHTRVLYSIIRQSGQAEADRLHRRTNESGEGRSHTKTAYGCGAQLWMDAVMAMEWSNKRGVWARKSGLYWPSKYRAGAAIYLAATSAGEFPSHPFMSYDIYQQMLMRSRDYN